MKLQFKIKFTQLKALGNLINKVVIQDFELIEYTDYYNLKKFCKMILDKEYRRTTRVDNTYTINIEPTMFDSLIRVNEIADKMIPKTDWVLERVLLRVAIEELYKDKARKKIGFSLYS